MGVIALDRESDGDIEDDLFGIIELEDSAEGVVDFKIDLFGQFDGTDIHQFGFFSTYDGPLAIDPTSLNGAQFSVVPDGYVSGLGQTQFDFVVGFDNGTPALEPIVFSLIGDSSFDAADILQAPTQLVRGEQELAGVHVQRTNTPAGSEALLGTAGNETVPEPSSAIAFAALAACAFLAKRRKR